MVNKNNFLQKVDGTMSSQCNCLPYQDGGPCDSCRKESQIAEADRLINHIYNHCLGSDDFDFSEEESKLINDYVRKYLPEEL